MIVRCLFLFLSFSGYTTDTFSQKPPINHSIYDKWLSVQGGAISNDGNYILYSIKNLPSGGDCTRLMSTHTDWKTDIHGSFSVVFTKDNRKAIWIMPTDSLGILELGSPKVEYVPNVSSFKLSDGWLVYKSNKPSRDVVVRNLLTGKNVTHLAVKDYFIGNNSNLLLVQSETRNNTIVEYLRWVDLVSGNITTIFEGKEIKNLVFDAGNTQLAFTVENRVSDHTEKSIWYYKVGSDKAALVSNGIKDIKDSLLLENVRAFSRDGNSLYVTLKNRDRATPLLNAVQVDVWSYKDAKLQSQQLKELGESRSYLAVINVKNQQLIRLEFENDEGWITAFHNKTSDSVAFIAQKKADAGGDEDNWNIASQRDWCLVSTKDGTRTQIKELKRYRGADMYISPGNRYVVFYDPNEKSYFSYSTIDKVLRNITKGLPAIWTIYGNSWPNAQTLAYTPCGWLKDDAAVLLYDQNDIWEVDLTGKVAPVNITNGYGRKHNIVFRLERQNYEATIEPGTSILLSAFNRRNKQNGFYNKTIGKVGDPQKLTMGPYVFDVPDNNQFVRGVPPIRARDAEVYLVKRSSATESPNYFYTVDFKNFIRASDVHPEKDYNWLKSELISWKAFNGILLQGVLYKPENFDPKKKYPIIFYYYRTLSDCLNVYLKPEPSSGTLNIARFVSDGYLVFTPDINFTIGETGEGAVNAVVSAAKYLSRMPWVDRKRMGIQGHSFGGFETNYLVTHTNIFAAACSAAGLSDFISAYGSIPTDFAYSKQGQFEMGPYQIGKTLWERSDLYIKNSPIFRADKVTTPLLMMYNKGDGAIPFAQGIEFFTSLRRLGKRAWMLQYDDGTHTLVNKSAEDFSIRLAQFFDHYLKGAPSPKWMTEGVSAAKKGIESGLELDLPTRIP